MSNEHDSMGTIINHIGFRNNHQHLPDEQQSPLAEQTDPVPLPHGRPGLRHKCGFRISNRQTILSGVFIRHPKGPQQILGPTQCPSELGPQDMHCLDRPFGGNNDLFPPGGQLVIKQADERDMMRRIGTIWFTVVVDILILLHNLGERKLVTVLE